MIRNIIFDLGNVLLNFKPKEFMKRFSQDEQRIDSLVSRMIGPEVWFKLDRGVLTWKEAKKIYLEKFPEEKDILKPFLESAWEMLTPIEENVKILRELKEKGYNLYVLSSFIKEAFAYVRKKYDFFSLFDGILLSYQEKLIKPEKEIYQKLVDRFDLNPEECIYIDDHDFILKPAEKLGMKTIHFTENTDLKNELKSRGVKI